MLEDTLTFTGTGYTKYGLVNPFQAGLYTSNLQTGLGHSSVQYQNTQSLDRLVGTIKGILKECHYTRDISSFSKSTNIDLAGYKEIITKAALHLTESCRTIQDYGSGRHVNTSAADIRASASIYAISSTNYTLDAGVALVTAKQYLLQSSYNHTITDLHQIITQQQYTRAEASYLQSRSISTQAAVFELSAENKLEQLGSSQIYADNLTLEVGTKQYGQQKAKGLSIKTIELVLDSTDLYLKGTKVDQTAQQYRLYAQDLNVSGDTAKISGNLLNLSANTVRLGGGLVFLGGSVTRASRPIEREASEVDIKEFEFPPKYPTSNLLPSQEATGINMGGVNVMLPPQGTSGIETKKTVKNKNSTVITYPKPDSSKYTDVTTRPSLND